MNRQQAQKIIRETFESSFDRNVFTIFIKNLLNKIDEAPFIYKGNYIPDAYKQYIKALERIGKYSDNENNIDILIVTLQKETSLERARTMQRNFIAWYLNGSRGGERKDAALVAFLSPDKTDWRFSLVKMDYRFEQTKSGKVKVKEEFTPARRWSFLVGANEKSHTAQSRLLPILQNDQVNPTLKELEEAFSVERVTKEFFEKYRDLFLRLKESLDKFIEKNNKIETEFEEKNIDTVNFAKKLLGQIVFLYFLQKKGWFGVPRGKNWGEGNKQFLRQLYNKANKENKNFFNDYLEPLFYQALRYDRSADDDYFSQFDCKIPFLNGGLFDPMNDYDWINIDILLPNKLFSNQNRIKEGDIGNGILDVFDLYNFTVKEDEPLEKEVAIDPEMLGKVFENLLEVKDRKSKGTYYTPREIVHYMCQESLINYLATELVNKVDKKDIETFIKHGESFIEHDSRVVNEGRETERYAFKLPTDMRKNAKLIDDKLASIRVCDPAVGSGAFLVGMMNEIIRGRNTLTPYISKNGKRTLYGFKRQAIQNCLYGVDIDPGAVEIAKLRLWLSLIVDEEERRMIQPLPNLDYKIVQGNSLLSVEKNVLNYQLFNNLEELKPLFFNETNIKRKQEYKNQIDDLINQITNRRKDFDFEIYFSEVFHEKKGFDVVIGNPPYGFRNVLTPKEKKFFRKEKGIKFPSGDVAELFIVISYNNIVRTKGILTFIIPKKSLYGQSWINVRKLWIANRLIYLMDASKAFEKVLLEQISFSLTKTKGGKFPLAIGALDQQNLRIQVFGYYYVEEIFTKNLYNAQIYRGLYPSTLLQKISSYCIKNTSEFIKGEIGISNITSHLTFNPERNYPCVKGVDIVKYGLKHERYLKGDIAKKFISNYSDDKIVAQKIVAHVNNPLPHIVITIFYDDKKRLINDTCVEIKVTGANITKKFLLAYLQSSFCNWYAYNLIYNRAIRTMDFINYYIAQIPIPKTAVEDPDCQKPFITLVDKILSITKDNNYLENPFKQAKVQKYEKQIDQLVYKLYDLTQEEIKIIEGK
jgi:hypothetical protein